MRRTLMALPVAVAMALAGCAGADLSPPPPRVAVPIPGEDPMMQRGNTQQPVDATTIPGVSGR